MIVIPLVNPDGYEYTKQNRFWRKNRDVHTAERHKSCPGVDLNRNWGVGFGSNGGGATANPCGETYHGISAFSAPESKALRDLFAKIGFDRITVRPSQDMSARTISLAISHAPLFVVPPPFRM